MEEKKDYCYCRSENGKGQNVSAAAFFTAGLVVLMVCLKHASLLFFVEVQWRAWVFLVLNIVVLGIYFTSINPNSSQISHQESKKDDDDDDEEEEEEEEEEEMKMKMGNCNEFEACKEDDHHQLLKSKKIICNKTDQKLEKDEVMVEEENIETPKLSKEELNERVEAFIAMFRQHLALDARKGRDHKFYVDTKQADMNMNMNMNMKKKKMKKHINHSSDGVNCFVLKVHG